MTATPSHETPNPAERELAMLDDLIVRLTEQRREVYRAGLATITSARSRADFFRSDLAPGERAGSELTFPLVVNSIAYGEPHSRMRGPWFVTVTRFGAGEKEHLGLYLADLTYGARVTHSEPSGALTIEQSSVPVFLVPALGEVLWAHECHWETIENEAQLRALGDTSIYGRIALDMFKAKKA